jgi:hypothetical protein
VPSLRRAMVPAPPRAHWRPPPASPTGAPPPPGPVRAPRRGRTAPTGRGSGPTPVCPTRRVPPPVREPARSAPWPGPGFRPARRRSPGLQGPEQALLEGFMERHGQGVGARADLAAGTVAVGVQVVQEEQEFAGRDAVQRPGGGIQPRVRPQVEHRPALVVQHLGQVDGLAGLADTALAEDQQGAPLPQEVLHFPAHAAPRYPLHVGDVVIAQGGVAGVGHHFGEQLAAGREDAEGGFGGPALSLPPHREEPADEFVQSRQQGGQYAAPEEPGQGISDARQSTGGVAPGSSVPPHGRRTTDHRPQTTDHRPQTTDDRPRTTEHPTGPVVQIEIRVHCKKDRRDAEYAEVMLK